MVRMSLSNTSLSGAPAAIRANFVLVDDQLLVPVAPLLLDPRAFGQALEMHNAPDHQERCADIERADRSQIGGRRWISRETTRRRLLQAPSRTIRPQRRAAMLRTVRRLKKFGSGGRPGVRNSNAARASTASATKAAAQLKLTSQAPYDGSIQASSGEKPSRGTDHMRYRSPRNGGGRGCTGRCDRTIVDWRSS